MPATGRDRNDSSSEEESDDEVIVQPRRRASGFRVLGAPPAANPQEAKAAVLGQIQNMASQQQAHEVVSAPQQVTEKTEEEKRALEERQRMLQQQQIAKAQQAAAIQAAAARVAQAHSQNTGANQVDIQAKEQAARAQAEAERRAAEARQAQAKALQAAQEQAKKAQEEALRKAQQAKTNAEEQARAVKQQQENALAAQKAQVEAQARAQAEANAKAAEARKAQQEAQAKAQLEVQARTEAAKKAQAEAQARAQAEAQARSQALKAQQEAQIRANAQAQMQAKAQAEAQAKAQAAKAQAEAQAKAQAAKAQADAQARSKAQAEAQEKAQADAQARAKAQAGAQAAKAQAEAQAKAQADAQARAKAQAGANAAKAQAEAQAKTRQQQQQVAQNVKPAVANTNTRVGPATPQKTQTRQNIASVQSTSGSSPAGMLDLKKEMQGSVASSELQTSGATLIHHAPRPTGNKPTWNPVQKSVPQKDLGPLDRNGPLKQTAKAQEDQLPNSEIRAAPPTVGVATAQKPTIRQENVVEKFVEKQAEQPLPEPTQRAGVQMLAGAERWERESTIREQQATTMGGENTEKPAAVRLQDDSCWMTQHRQPVEIQPPQIGKVAIPELTDGHAVQKTVIVTKPQSYQKVKWNEFPEELKPEIGQAPKVQTQEWVPVNQEQQDLQRSLYKPAKISRVWPPPEDTLARETAPMSAVKASDDNAWIQQEQNEVMRSAAWSSTAAKINRVWPPPEEDGSDRGYAGPQHMPAVQWPPSESEQHEREQVEVLQKHLPTKKIERQWPPPPPQYQEVPVSEVITNQTQQGVLAK